MVAAIQSLYLMGGCILCCLLNICSTVFNVLLFTLNDDSVEYVLDNRSINKLQL